MSTGRPPPEHQDEWDKAAREFHRDLLTKAQSTAKVWSEGVAALLGLFGTVALVAGTDQISDLQSGIAQVAVVGLVVLADLRQQVPVTSSRKRKACPVSTLNTGTAWPTAPTSPGTQTRQRGRSMLAARSAPWPAPSFSSPDVIALMDGIS
ncbi:MAG: hypothetical protein M3R09_08685 [Actinomycetota bacterium]|nr:hypothetical protein [Actinomycetota bacterium]